MPVPVPATARERPASRPSPRRSLLARTVTSLCAVTVVRLEQRTPFVTQDGSAIRELAGLPSGNAANQSLAQATLQPGGETEEHFHRQTEEIYLFTDGEGRMRLGEQEFTVRAGDCVVIEPGVPHKLWADPGRPALSCSAAARLHTVTRTPSCSRNRLPGVGSSSLRTP